MRKYIAEYLANFLEFQHVRSKHQHLVGLLHPLPILERKWEVLTIDFITIFPKYKIHNDSIMVVVDKLSKVAHFILVQSTYKAVQIADIFMKQVFILHGIPEMVI